MRSLQCRETDDEPTSRSPFNGESHCAVAGSGQTHLGDRHHERDDVHEGPVAVVLAHLGQREADAGKDEVEEVPARQADHQVVENVLKWNHLL